jgi:hypothetical protein
MMKMSKFLGFFLLLGCLLWLHASAQVIAITGKVTSAHDGSPLARVKVEIKGTNQSVTTDPRGNYTIRAAGDATLIFSLPGMKTTSVPVGKRTVIDVAMQNETLETKVDQVIVLLQGNTAWKNTGLVLREGDKVEFKATGKVCFNQNDQPASCVGPDGYASDHPNPPEAYLNDYLQTDSDWCDDPEPQWAHAALIARDHTGTFFVGNSRIVTGRNGPLEIGINDCTLDSPAQFRNTGEFSVVIKVVRGGK